MPDTEFTYKEIFKKREYSKEMIWPELYSQEFIDFTTDADAVIVFVGSMESEDTEKLDRRSLELNPNYEMTITMDEEMPYSIHKKGDDMIG